ncbi:Zinc finger CCCH domain protein [Quillaja saponaria]|uniref:Zinc finger CCCH domain protein n=1 Tax=Quillaja saponaria TaxID=32244 RepID=A0AAD7M103_QUISA|nr:Zinc finger CCCH domain protein [Quillaja saponaria]
MVKKNSIKKEEVAEDWCFLCKDGGLLMVCEHKDCNKAYHPTCVGKDDSFVETGSRWTCGWHSCFVCHKNSKFRCFCCPNAVCGRRICGDEFARIKGNKGLCNHCLKLALLIEENIDTDSDGDKIDFKDRETYEGLFLEYYEIIKEKEGLNSLQIQSANKLLKKGRNYSDSDLNEIDEEEDDTGEESNSLVSDYDDLNDTADLKPARKRKRCTRKPNSLKRKVNTKKKEFIGWGSRTLIEFLNFIGKDTRKELSQHDVNSIITGYCKENKLFHPEKKRKVICDEQLQSLFGRKSVNKNSIFNLLTAHLAENVEQMEEDEVEYSSDDRGELVPVGHERRKALSSSKKHHKELVPEVQQSCLASIVTENIKLVYLKRSLVEELLKQPETFDGKLIGSFVRIKSDPNDYLQKNYHQLLQVTGAKRSSNNESSSETLLQLCNFPRDLPICKLSDDDFSEEECKDLCHRMSCGLLQQPTVGVLEQKARSLHEDITKHWIMRQLTLLQIRIDRANEKGWRREYPFTINILYIKFQK